jgi:hypothetical protein
MPMVPLMSLWIPIIVAAVLVFLVSSVIHMFLGYHANDYRKLPDEDGLMAALRPYAIPPGDYAMPHAASMKAMSSKEYVDKQTAGPVAIFTVLPNGPSSMGRSLGLWFGYCILVGVFAAYITGRALGPGAEYMEVFRFAGTTAVAGYALALLQNSIWYFRDWRATLLSVMDGVIYALLTAGVFGWLWPQ